MSLAEQYRSSGYTDWYNPIDADVCHESPCCKCGHLGLIFTGFKRESSRIAIATCPDCGYEQEF